MFLSLESGVQWQQLQLESGSSLGFRLPSEAGLRLGASAYTHTQPAELRFEFRLSNARRPAGPQQGCGDSLEPRT